MSAHPHPTILRWLLPPDLKGRLKERHGRGLAKALRAAIVSPPPDVDWSVRAPRPAALTTQLDATTRGQLEQLAATHGLTLSDAMLRLAEAIGADD